MTAEVDGSFILGMRLDWEIRTGNEKKKFFPCLHGLGRLVPEKKKQMFAFFGDNQVDFESKQVCFFFFFLRLSS